MLRFKNLLDSCHCFHPSGHPSSVQVGHDQLIEVPGEIVLDLPDALVVEHDGDRRAWPKARWELLQNKPSSKKSTSVDAEPADV